MSLLRQSFDATSFSRPTKNGGAIKKFRSIMRDSCGRASGIPRPSTLQGIHKMGRNGGIVKSHGRHSMNSGRRIQTRVSSKTSSCSNSQRCMNTNEVNSKQISIKTSQNGPIFKEVIPLNKSSMTCKQPVRRVLQNLSNSPITVLEQRNQATTTNSNLKYKETAKQMLSENQAGIEFEADPQALASILNNEGITTQFLQQTALKQAGGVMVKDNALLLADGRPSLCRRVPIRRATISQFKNRPSMSGPQRVLVSAKKGSLSRFSVTGQRNSFIKPTLGNSRNSLYSVVQGRYSCNEAGFKEGKQSLTTGVKQAKQVATEEKRLKENFPLKSPLAKRVTPPDVRISASPALRIRQTSHITPQPQRASKRGNQRGVKWADEASSKANDHLATNLFKDYSEPVTPNIAGMKPVKSPVSILKSRKHTKRSSPTPPVMKRDKKIIDVTNGDFSVEVVKPQVLNEAVASSNAREKPKINSEENFKHQVNWSPSVLARQTEERVPTIKVKNSPVLEAFKDKNDTSKPQKNTVEVDEVLNIMQRHLSTVKRRSVQSEVCNVIKHITASLKATTSSCDTIPEEETSLPDHYNGTTRVMEGKLFKRSPSKNKPTRIEFPLTPGTIKEIRENGDDETNRSLDEITNETERISEELKQLQLEKEKLTAFQQKVKKLTIKPKETKKKASPRAIVTEKCPSFSSASPELLKVSHSIPVAKSWEKILKSDMNSPVFSSFDAKSRSWDFTDNEPVTPKLASGHNFIATKSPHLSALHLEKSPAMFAKTKREFCCSASVTDPVMQSIRRADSGDSDKKSALSISTSDKPFDFITSLDDFHPKSRTDTMLAAPNSLVSNSMGAEISLQTQSPSVSHVSKSFLRKEQSPLHTDSVFAPSTALLQSSSVTGTITNVSFTNTKEQPKLRSETIFNNNQLKLSDVRPSTFTDARSECSPQIRQHSSFISAPPHHDLVNPMTSTLTSESLSPHQTMEGRSCSPSMGEKLVIPAPIFPLPPQTPAAFRALRMKMSAKARPSPSKEGTASTLLKQQFAQALLDEEVSLLTCRVVRPSKLLQNHSVEDPVAQSLTVGDASHFVPVTRTPGTPQRRSRRSSFIHSAFSQYLRT